MNPNDVTWGIALRVWWAWTWRVMVFMMLMMIPIQVLFFLFAFSGFRSDGQMDPQFALMFVPLFMTIWLAAVVGGLFIQIFVMKKILAKEFPTFRVQILSK